MVASLGYGSVAMRPQWNARAHNDIPDARGPVRLHAKRSCRHARCRTTVSLEGDEIDARRLPVSDETSAIAGCAFMTLQ
jgi:hypothetical protein